MDFEFTADTWSWRAALRSTLPHIASEKVSPELCRLRVSITAAGVFVAATDRYTMALSRVRLVGDGPMALGCFDLDPASARLLLAVHKPGKNDDDPMLRVEVTEKRLTATDATGMFDGRSLTMPPAPPHPRFPDVARIVAAMWPLRGAMSALEAASDYLGRFAASAREHTGIALAEPVADGRSLVVSSGDDFVGVLMLRSRRDESREYDAAVQRRWRTDFAEISRVAPELPVDPPEDADADISKSEPAPVDLTTIAVDLDTEPGDQ